jgi:hypothetical protein
LISLETLEHDYYEELQSRPVDTKKIRIIESIKEHVIKNFLKELDKFLSEESLNENEIKLGHALYDIFSDYENIFVGTSNNKFNKNIILLSLREMTNLSTKEIRSSMKKYRMIYLNLVEKMAQ